MLKMLRFFVIFLLSGVVLAGELKPYNDVNEVLKDLKKSLNLASKIATIDKKNSTRYELLGKAVTLQGIMCRRSEISQFVIVQKAFEILRHNHGEINSDYIVFTENCRNMFGLYE
ncbi:hypothetical protein DCO58_10060 [Helicobacter saguini]|uniref:Uncharacterized protein n=1 Tax=Helicobacter saguini TaxID=1548018 RepID=A0A347VPI0_9HELI|nr:hypothetical protein [Helicobacter saguini]MWV61351.1 hypothetical protein [Helicobacter saguini]MWV67979.1 hypothetical protein [Helicobacter saguini]MWV70553.1 hypothetical protein [Helicobacter saguini]MWV72457.1 hypothetical protein [Helicobacter saguini]TLD94788.1 hypothetical protein LS64_004620 [Helicobacter saguini]